MAWFMTRVELHLGDSGDYEELHAAMASKGFSRILVGDNGAAYKLPTAEYFYDGEEARKHVLVLAKEAAESTMLSYSIVVGECTGLCWSNLVKI